MAKKALYPKAKRKYEKAALSHQDKAAAKKYKLLLPTLRRLIDAGDRVQASRVADIGNALEHDAEQKRLIVSDVHIAARVSGQLGFTAALSRQEAEGDQFPFGQCQSLPGIKIAEAVIRQPAVDRSRFPSLFHLFTEDIRLCFDPLFQTVFHRCGRAGGKAGDPFFSEDLIHRLQKRKRPPVAKVVGRLIAALSLAFTAGKPSSSARASSSR